MPKHKKSRGEKGVALIAVMGILALAALIAAAVVVLSQSSRGGSRSLCELNYGGYAAESALARAQWLLMSDKSANSSRNLGTDSGVTIPGARTSASSDTQERFMADGRPHIFSMGDYSVKVKILDAASGIDISGGTASSNLTTLQNIYGEDIESLDAYRKFLDSFKDYVDSDEGRRSDGTESSDYLAMNMPPLPRNRAMRFREEILWIPQAEKFFKPDSLGRMSLFRLIPPRGLPALPTQQSFFSMDAQLIRSLGSYSDEDMAKIESARSKWLDEGQVLSSATELSENTLKDIRAKFSFKESGYYTFIITAQPENGGTTRTLVASFQLGTQVSANGILYYEWARY